MIVIPSNDAAVLQTALSDCGYTYPLTTVENFPTATTTVLTLLWAQLEDIASSNSTTVLAAVNAQGGSYTQDQIDSLPGSGEPGWILTFLEYLIAWLRMLGDG